MNFVPKFTILGSGPVILMLHGIGGGHLAFAPQVERFASEGYRAVSWDMPGYGASAPIEPYTFKALAQSCIALIDALQAEHVILIGHSMGGMVAQEVVARAPQRVSHLVLAGTSASFGSSDGAWQQQFIADRTAPLDAGKSMADLAQTLVPRMVGAGAMPEGVQLGTHCMSLVPEATYRRALECLVTFDRKEALGQIRVPTLLIGGEFDRTAPSAVMRRMSDRIRGSNFIELAGIGHLQPLEAPDAFDDAVLRFLNLPAELRH